MNKLALIITIIGALNWGSIGLFQFDLVAWIFGGAGTLLERIVSPQSEWSASRRRRTIGR